jgi:alpha-D-xyloside xylohydrolase
VYDPPDGLRWLPVTAAAVTESTDTGFVATLTYSETLTAQLQVEAVAPGRFRLAWAPLQGGDAVAYYRIRPRVDPAEAFYGLGAQLDDVNLRGKLKAMQLELDSLESGYNEAHVPVPFVLGTRGWGLFVECPYPGVFDVAVAEADRVEATFGLGLAAPDGITFHLFAADHPLDVTRHYYDVTGYPVLPARWALGPWIWRDENDDQAQVSSDASTIRALDLAVSGYWIDRPYASGVNTFDFDPGKFDDAQAMLDELHDLGFRVALWHTPYLDEDDPDTAALLDEAVAGGYYPPETGIRFNNWSDLIDLTNPDAYAWWQDLIRRYTDMGVEGFKLDYAEDVVTGVWGARNVWEFFDGSDERTMHSRYQLFYHRVYAETLPPDGGFLLCRAGTYGDQQNVSVIWPGDLDANFAHHGEERTDDGGYTAVGGLPASLIYGLTLGPSGFPFYGADTGGYRHAPPDKEVFTRWFQQTALSSVMQVGTNTNDVPWEPTPENGFDAEMLDWFRVYARLHLRLFPYEWTHAQRILVDGRPLQRPFGLQHPELGVHPWDQYFFGDDLLVAPVLERDARQRDVRFPPGRWVDWFSGEVHDGDQLVTVDAPLDKLPLYQREGSLIPLLRPTIDTLAPTTADASRVDSYATDPGVLYVRVFAGATSTFTLFDGAEVGQGVDSGTFTLTYVDGDEFTAGALFHVVAFGTTPPAAVTDGGVALSVHLDLATLEAADTGWFHDPTGTGTLHVKVGGGSATVTVSLP